VRDQAGGQLERDRARKPRALVAGGFCLGLVGISCAAIFVRLAQPAPPAVVAFYRMFLASVLMAAALGVTPGLRQQLPGGWRALSRSPHLHAAALAGLLFGIDHAFWHTSILATSVANATPVPTEGTVVESATSSGPKQTRSKSAAADAAAI
jgi:drug/metabolite transporter (DMT)-like permease